MSTLWKRFLRTLSPPENKPSCPKDEDGAEDIARSRLRLETAVTTITADNIRDHARHLREKTKEYKRDIDQFEKALTSLLGDMHGGNGDGSVRSSRGT